MKRSFGTWETTECDSCGIDFQVTRTNPLETEDDVICEACEMFERGRQQGLSEKSEGEPSTNEILLKILEQLEQINENTKKPTRKKAPATPASKRPTWEEVAKYFHEKGSATCQDDATRFIDFYTANGWRVGKNPMKDWKATVRTWMKRKQDDQQSNRARLEGTRAGHDAISNDNDF